MEREKVTQATVLTWIQLTEDYLRSIGDTKGADEVYALSCRIGSVTVTP